MKRLSGIVSCLLAGLCIFLGGCGKPSREIKIDGSSTVLLVSEAAATNYMSLHPQINVTVGASGTGGGFKKFYAGETDISNASRPIKDKEVKKCKDAGIDFVELQVAWDGLSVIINEENDWARKMTVAQLKTIWHPDTAAKKWSDVNPDWPNEKIVLSGPGTNSGTFDYFTDEINGKEDVCRNDFDATEDDNLIINVVRKNKYAMGFLGFAYFRNNQSGLQAVEVAVDEKSPHIGPTEETILSGTYKPLSRPLFIYAKVSSLKEKHVQEFVEFMLRRTDLVEEVGYVPLGADQRWIQRKKMWDAIGK